MYNAQVTIGNTENKERNEYLVATVAVPMDAVLWCLDQTLGLDLMGVAGLTTDVLNIYEGRERIYLDSGGVSTGKCSVTHITRPNHHVSDSKMDVHVTGSLLRVFSSLVTSQTRTELKQLTFIPSFKYPVLTDIATGHVNLLDFMSVVKKDHVVEEVKSDSIVTHLDKLMRVRKSVYKYVYSSQFWDVLVATINEVKVTTGKESDEHLAVSIKQLANIDFTNIYETTMTIPLANLVIEKIDCESINETVTTVALTGQINSTE